MNGEVDRLLEKSNKVLGKTYKHFDVNPSKSSAKKFIANTVLKPNVIARYRFYPFIIYSQVTIKYHRTKGHLRAHVRDKVRPLSLVAHHDALIYVKYADELNSSYEEYLVEHNFSNVPTAYRKSRHTSNINAAKEVFDFIVAQNDCWIIKGDFKGFFDNLRHRILKENLRRVMSVAHLTPDWLAVFKSVTRYNWVMSAELNKSLKKANLVDRKWPAYLKERKDFAKLIADGNLNVNGFNQIGIPQGTPISAALANVYMIEFDEKLNKIALEKGGLYRRYSDDFVIVIPKKNLDEEDLNIFLKGVIDLSQLFTSLEIERHKTKIFSFGNSDGTNVILQEDKSKNFIPAWLDYLGFIFNGSEVKMRERGVYKFHYKSKKAINKFLRIRNDRNQILSRKVPTPDRKQRLVWQNGKQKRIELNQYDKRLAYKKRIEREEKRIKANAPNSKMVAKMYTVGKRYGERYSMIGYAKRAQTIFSNNKGRYKVSVLNQINDQIKNNQFQINRIRDKGAYAAHKRVNE
ncbi:reverse transcriptase/maturase family protein [Lapidilactobacillus wuchangensis]|uniref:reverse transcriptase/maturase family protein n=1 Tax=Lapidilactobacillus wuchangensis TaxID=2486001 RepID=UPI000F76C1B2|nr:reverse transcriptase/maturase family protein [Lapidilactobacillus wuchangensis]